MKDITAGLGVEHKLLSAAVVSDSWRQLFLEAYDEILWLRKEGKMWRLRATGAASQADLDAMQPVDDEVRETQP